MVRDPAWSRRCFHITGFARLRRAVLAADLLEQIRIDKPNEAATSVDEVSSEQTSRARSFATRSCCSCWRVMVMVVVVVVMVMSVQV
jgi:type IV secretory pathway component VirB8